MSKLLELAAEVVINQETGKRRIRTSIYRDADLDVSFVFNANDAEQWAARLMYLAGECRKKNPNPETVTLWQRPKSFLRAIAARFIKHG